MASDLQSEVVDTTKLGWKRWFAIGAVALLLLGALFVWRYSPLPPVNWTVAEIIVDGNRVDPLDSTISTSLGIIAFHGCNEMTAQAGGLPWKPRLGPDSSTAVGCLGPMGDLDASWIRLVKSSVTFDGVWKKTATIRGNSVEMRLRRAT
ncbi:MAG TPA: hypothetical protein VL068_05575 [Microthrixaceae bacterium]|nr:hypothetical protein [Microthrixaceae bacterium]